MLTDDKMDLAANGIDFAIRIAQLEDSSLKARKIGNTRVICAASPHYLSSHTPIARPQDLSDHNTILDRNRANLTRAVYLEAGGDLVVQLHGNLIVNGIRACARLASEGHGIMFGPEIYIQHYLQTNALVEVLPEHHRETRDISVLQLPSHVKNAKLQEVIDFIRVKLSTQCRETKNP